MFDSSLFATSLSKKDWNLPLSGLTPLSAWSPGRCRKKPWASSSEYARRRQNA